MKRFITGVIAATALLFGFAGCSGALHDMGDAPIAKVPTKIVGAMTYTTDNVFEDMTVVDSTTSTYTFKYTTAISANWGSPADGVNFKVGYVDKEWATCWSEATAGTTALVNGAASVLCTAQNKENISFSGLTDGKTYKITATTGISCVTVAIAETDAAPVVADPTPYYLDGLYLVGTINNWADGMTPTYLLYNPTLEKKTGVLTYTKDFTASNTSDEFVLSNGTWKVKYGITAVAVDAADYVALATDADANTVSNSKISGLTAGNSYRMYITTTPDGVVSVKIESICSYKLTFKVTGLDDGTEIYIDGTPWGSSWKACWPITSWNGDYATAKAKYPECFATADTNGDATFAASLSFVGKPNETASYEIKYVSCTADGADPVISSSNIPFDVTVNAGTFVVSVDSTTEKVTVTQQ